MRPKAQTGGSPPIVSAEGLTRIYRLGATEVVGVHRIDLTVAEGEMVVIKGNSGSGKSTLLSLIAGLDRPTAGRLSVAGHDLNRTSEAAMTRYRREVVGMVFQSFNLLPTLNVRENVCLPALLAGKPHNATRGKAEEILDWLGMAARLDHVNIVRGIDVGREGNSYYFAMEFVEGESVGKMLVRDKKLPEELVLRIGLQIARAIDPGQVGLPR